MATKLWIAVISNAREKESVIFLAIVAQKLRLESKDTPCIYIWQEE